ncbi:DHA1 family inner membrane transport protein [Actinokineospora auranticolor]|uniref:DHA1 family inner membrane transport protein n=2 Tax=Actinokineospora auranticolor TaxID=155976 RepID=A0A2S6GJM3_9PSEU|nr:DHA1 family inner membrane transport protein [Actinokineospora auranticolor]
MAVVEQGIAPRSKVALGILGLGAFVVGTAELVVVGVLDLIALDIGVRVSTAGLLVTAYAVGISLGGPIVTALTIRLGQRVLLWVSLAVYVVGNGLAVVASDFGQMLVARVLTGTIHGLFIGVASSVAAALVPAAYRGRAISIVFGGIGVSTVLGVPLGAFIGQALGWQAAFVGIVGLGVAALCLTIGLVPAVPELGSADLRSQVRHALAPRVLGMLAVGLLLMGGQFSAFTYLAQYLGRVTGVTGEWVSVFLFAYGIACAAGIFIGGKFADTKAYTTLVTANVVLVGVLLLMHFLGGSPVVAIASLLVWGLFGFGLVPAFQLRVITLAGEGADLAATLGASAVNAGIAIGAVLGGSVVTNAGDPSRVFLVAFAVCAVALPFTLATRWYTAPRRAVPDEAAVAV